MNSIDLIEEKDFSELNAKELSYVLQEMTEKEYRDKREIYLMSKEFFSQEEIELSVPVPSRALNALKQKRKKRAPLVFLLNTKVSLWKAAALFLIFFGSYQLLRPINKSDVEKVYITEFVDREIEGPTKIDTVYKERIKKVYINAEVKNDRVSNPEVKRDVQSYDLSSIAMLNNIEETIGFTNPDRGYNLNDDTLAKKIIGI